MEAESEGEDLVAYLDGRGSQVFQSPHALALHYIFLLIKPIYTYFGYFTLSYILDFPLL